MKIVDLNKSGFILITAIILSFVCSGIIFAYYTKISIENKRVNIKIVKARARYNALSGFALEAYENMFYRDFNSDSLESGFADSIKYYNAGNIIGMGSYDSVSVRIRKNQSGQLVRYGFSMGFADYHTLWGNKLTFKDSMDIKTGSLPTLNTYMYLTAEEVAGGAPQTLYDGVRGSINFRQQDQFSGGNNGKIQSNGTLEMAGGTAGCPTFNSTVTLTTNDDGSVNSPDMGGCNPYQVFLGQPPLDTAKAVCLPPPSFDERKQYADYTFDAMEMLVNNGDNYTGYIYRDTLIMTEIEFLNDGGFRSTRYWYLVPPHLKTGVTSMIPDGSHLETDGLGSGACNSTMAINECNQYEQALNRYHARTTANDTEEYIDFDIRFSHGIHNFDTHKFRYDPGLSNPEFSPNSNNSTMISNEYYFPTQPTAIYIKGGPVLVHGTYKGKYTVITDEYLTYRRHAYPINNAAQTPVDTIMCNIWIVDDLVNVDANSSGSMIGMQPTDDCIGGSDNILGLVSGANVIIANTRSNGARKGWAGDLHIKINAHMIAFNESFTIQYWQNSTNDYWDQFNNYNLYLAEITTLSDGNGLRYGNSTNDDDDRGNVYLWGGFVQQYRGYMFRNSPGPYNITPGIGMDKHYSWDDNLRCITPPLYPESIECDQSGNSSGQYNFPINQLRIF